jgi:Lon-like ATP-dependent protease
LNCLREVINFNTIHKEQFQMLIDQMDFTQPSDIADVSVLLTSVDPAKLQDVLATASIEERLMKTVTLLRQELETLRMQSKISKNLDERVSSAQKKYYLSEQLKLIKKELGLEHDEKDAIMEKFNDRLKDKKVPEAAMKVIQEEMSKLSTLEVSSSEFNVCRNYLDWLTILPWGMEKEENFDLKHAQKVLDEDHYGLVKLKERILEFIAVGKLKGTVQGKIICFVGPPGVGKTSIGKSIARALKREYFRFSVGGMSDVSEIKGHRRTYIGAMPGKLIQCLKQAKSSNPVILIDEIDKLGKGHGDPSSALLEVLDPEQNDSFLDHYLDVPFDLSKVLFICTANVLDTIPRPLLDRMEVLRISGYILQEKMNIAKKYLVPKIKEDCGINGEVTVTDGLLEGLIRDYCRESGVRNLQKHIERIFRKAAYKLVTDIESKGKKIAKPSDKKSTKRKPVTKPIIALDETALEEYVGKPNFSSDRYYFTTPNGVAMGLAWTSMGGSTLYIETTVEAGEKSPGLKVTGKIGDVMKESSSIAYTYAKNHYDKVKNYGNKWIKKEQDEQAVAEGEGKKDEEKKDFFGKHAIHMHIPEGATPKDGPSAGITMVTALLSLAYGRPVRHGLAMTGEITLTGKVLEIGGVKEKTIAARRSGVTDIILPIECMKEWEELDKEIKEGLKVHFVDYYDDVHKIAFEYDDEEQKAVIEAEKEQIKRDSPKLAAFYKLL